MAASYYKLFNKAEFEATGLVSKQLVVDLDDRGRVEFLISVGNTVSVTYDGELLPVGFLDANPYIKGGYAVYLDDVNGDVWFGFEDDA